MEYQLEELLPLTARLTECYTSMESSSVTYETAQMLMEAVIYSIEECFLGEGVQGNLPDAQAMYEQGCRIILEKAQKAKECYEALILDFDDYGCVNYRETIGKGLPAFFRNYDPKFCPQDHLLTLDYPMLGNGTEKRGIDLIVLYLKGITAEQKLLARFRREGITALLERVMPDYRGRYMDNILSPVLLTAAGCFLAEKPIQELTLTKRDCQSLAETLQTDTLEEIKRKTRGIIGLLANQLKEEEQGYLEQAAEEIGFRIFYGIENKSLDNVLFAVSST